MITVAACKIVGRCFISLFFLVVLQPVELLGGSQNNGPLLSFRIVKSKL
jgi:hypothetical protein